LGKGIDRCPIEDLMDYNLVNRRIFQKKKVGIQTDWREVYSHLRRQASLERASSKEKNLRLNIIGKNSHCLF